MYFSSAQLQGGCAKAVVYTEREIKSLFSSLAKYWQSWVAQRMNDPGSERGDGKRGYCVFALACLCSSVTPGNVSLSALQKAGEHVRSHWPGNCVTK